MPKMISQIMLEFAREMKKVFGNSLTEIIIYGSYARGDYTENSDVDVMVLVSSSDLEIKQKSDSVCECISEILMKYGVDISPVVKNESHFNYWVENLPYYRNVRDEGVKIIA